MDDGVGCGSRLFIRTEKATVKYDPDVVKIEDLTKVVKNARGMNSFNAKVKQK